jgi:hypothetical protein
MFGQRGALMSGRVWINALMESAASKPPMLRKVKDKLKNPSGGTDVPVTTKNDLGTRGAPADTMSNFFLHS